MKHNIGIPIMLTAAAKAVCSLKVTSLLNTTITKHTNFALSSKQERSRHSLSLPEPCSEASLNTATMATSKTMASTAPAHAKEVCVETPVTTSRYRAIWRSSQAAEGTNCPLPLDTSATCLPSCKVCLANFLGPELRSTAADRCDSLWSAWLDTRNGTPVRQLLASAKLQQYEQRDALNKKHAICLCMIRYTDGFTTTRQLNCGQIERGVALLELRISIMC
mmetsp:Transcript_69263/g.129329  ORF Transcript_69263/g.129329 Transcript_69263/m.129329 type:complete len:221 (-) Transcript_69263:19-681(-)